MSQAKILNSQELRRVLDYVATRKHSARNRAMLLLTHFAGMRVAEVANLRLCDVLNDSGSIKEEVRLKPDQTKGKYARTVYLNLRMQKELAQYVKCIKTNDLQKPLFYTKSERVFHQTHWLSISYSCIAVWALREPVATVDAAVFLHTWPIKALPFIS